MTDLLDFVSLSLLPPWCWRVAADWLRRGDPPAVVVRRLLAGSPRDAAGRRRGRPRRSPRTRSAAPTPRSIAAIPWSDPAYPAALTTIADPPPVLWTRGCVDALSAPAVAIVGSRAASPYGLAVAEQLAADLAACGPRDRQRPGARRRFRRASRRARRRRRHGGGARLGRRRHLSARARAARARDRRDRRRGQRAGAGHAAAAVVLSAAQPDHQRAVARGRRHRGGREERLADHRALRARSGTRRAGGAGQRAERPQPRRARAAAGRCKDRGVRGRYPGGAGHGPAAGPAGGGRGRVPDAGAPQAATRCSTAWCRARPPISTRFPSDPA